MIKFKHLANQIQIIISTDAEWDVSFCKSLSDELHARLMKNSLQKVYDKEMKQMYLKGFEAGKLKRKNK